MEIWLTRFFQILEELQKLKIVLMPFLRIQNHNFTDFNFNSPFTKKLASNVVFPKQCTGNWSSQSLRVLNRVISKYTSSRGLAEIELEMSKIRYPNRLLLKNHKYFKKVRDSRHRRDSNHPPFYLTLI